MTHLFAVVIIVEFKIYHQLVNLFVSSHRSIYLVLVLHVSGDQL